MSLKSLESLNSRAFPLAPTGRQSTSEGDLQLGIAIKTSPLVPNCEEMIASMGEGKDNKDLKESAP